MAGRFPSRATRPIPSRLGGAALVLALLAGLAGPAAAAQEPRADSPEAALRHLATAQGKHIGAAVAPGPLTGEKPYHSTLAREFNEVTPENALKWAEVEPQRGKYDWSAADRIIEFAQRHRQRVRGHTLVWHSQNPSWLANGDFAPDELRGILRDHIVTKVNRYEDRIFAWDVVNEPFNEDGGMRETMWLRKLGRDYIATALRWAHRADPDAKLYLNDYNIMGINPKSDAMYELVRSLKRRGVPIHGVGIQGHRILGQIPDSTEENIRRFAELGVDVAITELDVRIPMPASEQELRTQAANYAQVTEGCLAVRRCVGVTTWGFTDRHSWIPDWFEGQGAALPFDEQYRPKPAYYALREALAPGNGRGRAPSAPGSAAPATAAADSRAGR